MSKAQPIGGFHQGASTPPPEWLAYLQRWRPTRPEFSFLSTRRPDPLTLLLAKLKARAQAQEDIRHLEFTAGH